MDEVGVAKSSATGPWTVRREFSMAVATPEEARRVEGLCDRAFERMRRQIEAGKTTCPPMSQLICKFIDYRRTWDNIRPATADAHRRRLERFVADFDDPPIDTITREMLSGWVQRRLGERGKRRKYSLGGNLARDTANNDLKSLHLFAGWCSRQEYCNVDIDVLKTDLLRVDGKICQRHAPEACTPHYLKRMLAQLHVNASHIWTVLQAMLLWGLRPHALFYLRWSHVQWPRGTNNGRILVPATKGGIPGEIPIRKASTSEQLLSECRTTCKRFRGRSPTGTMPIFQTARGRSKRNPGGWTTAIFDNALRKAVHEAGLNESFTAYDVRRAAATMLAKRDDISSAGIQSYMRHRRADSQQAYRMTASIDAVEVYDIMEEVFAVENKKSGKSGKSSLKQHIAKVEVPLLITV